MGISRDSRHKHRRTGGRMPVHKKKRKFELGRSPAMTKIGSKRVRPVRCRGGNLKYRALRLDTGNFSWGSQNVCRKCRILDVVYNASNNELVRTKTLVKNTIVLVDATAFKQWYRIHFGAELGRKKGVKAHAEDASQVDPTTGEPIKVSKHLLAKQKYRLSKNHVDGVLEEQFSAGRVLACISSRPGQSGRADGYLLEGKELEFYKKKSERKKK